MADDSPGKVQALRAIFSEKNQPVMGMMPPGGKIPNRPWRSVVNSAEDVTSLKEKKLSELKLGNKVLPLLEKNSTFNGDAYKDINGCSEKLNRNITKPAVGPKPTHLVQQQRTSTPNNNNSNTLEHSTVQNSDSIRQRTFSDGQKSQEKSKAFGETIASFMFTNNKENNRTAGDSDPSIPPPLPKPRSSHLQNYSQKSVEILNFCNAQNGMVGKSDLNNQRCNLINSDNYICKGDYRIRRKVLPPQEKLGPAPLKPIKPSHMKLPLKYCSPSASESSSSVNVISSQAPPPLPPQKPIPQRPSYPCPPRPMTPPPLPPVLAPVIKPAPVSLRDEIEELYEDTLLGEKRRPVSLIPEYTEEEEHAELYNDTENSRHSDSPSHQFKKSTPVPSEYLQPNVHGSTEELYQDADGIVQEEFYEVMPCDEAPDESGSPLYSNNKKEIEKLKKEEEKRIRKEQKEREKRDKELEKLRKKFGLTGEEIPIDDGLVKSDSRGGKGDLPVKKGETVLILRMEGNPSGRWLVKNEKGKIGYVELTNIEVMSIRRLSVISAGEELYCEAKSEEEGIYEVTY